MSLPDIGFPDARSVFIRHCLPRVSGLMIPVHPVCSSASIRMLVFRQWLSVFLVLSLPALMQAQDDVTTPGDVPRGQILLRQDDGKIVPLEDLAIPSEKIGQFLEWLTTQINVPSFEITSIDASGKIQDDRAEIHVELEVEVHAENDWVRIPVEFPSWTIIGFQHAPAHPKFESRFAGNAGSGREWLLMGKGSHQLSLVLIAEVRSQDAGRQRLKMSLPNAVVSTLQLTFDELIEGVRDNAGRRQLSKSGDLQSTVTFWGLKQETEISWQSLAPAGDQATVISTPEPASMVLDLNARRAVLTCTQTIEIAEGAIDQLTVRLPSGYGEAAITGRDESGNSIVQSRRLSTTNGVSTAEINFTKPIRRRIELRFDLGLKDTTFPQVIFISVPNIDGVAEQSANIEIRIPRGLDVDISPGLLTRRTRVETQSDQRSEAITFDLFSTDASLQLNVREVEARFAVEPQLEFSTDEQRLLLLARFPVNVSPGSLDELQIDWIGYAQDEWQIDPASIYLTEDDGERQKLSYEPFEDSIRLPLGNFQSGQFSVEFSAFRSLVTDSQDGVVFRLPDVAASTVHPTVVSLIETDTYSLSLTNGDDGSLFSMVPYRQTPSHENVERATTWLVNDSRSSVRIRHMPQIQEVSSTAVVALDAVRDSVSVHTEISINVLHRDLRELRFTVPDGVEPTVRLSDHEDPLPRPEVNDGERVWQLPEAIRGQHLVSIDYHWTPESGADDIRLPLVLPSLGLGSLIIGTNIPDILSVVEDKTLRQQYSRTFQAAWSTSESRTDIAVRVPKALRHHRPRVPSICLVQSRINPSNVWTTTTAVYEVPPPTVLFRVPPGVGVFAMVNGVSVQTTLIDLGPMDSGELYQVTVPSDFQDRSARVSLSCQTPRASHHHLVSRADVTYSRVVGVPEWLTTVWVVGSPDHYRMVSLETHHQPVSSPGLADVLLFSSTNQISRTVETTLAGFPESVRSHFRSQFDDSFIGRRSALVFVVGPEFRTVPLLIYSRAMGWVGAAGLGVLLYCGMLFLRHHLRLVLWLAISASAVAWATLPQQTLTLLLPIVPAVAVVTIAWIFRQLLTSAVHQHQPRRKRNPIFVSAPRTLAQSSATSILVAAPPRSEAEPVVHQTDL